MANIVYLKKVANYFRMTVDTKKDHTMLVQYRKDKAYCFKECGMGLYYIDVSNSEIITLRTESGDTDYSLLSILNANVE